jgi:hypothetical protein
MAAYIRWSTIQTARRNWSQPSGGLREDELPLQEGHDGPRAYAGLGAEVALSGNLGASRGDRLAPGCLQTVEGDVSQGVQQG